MVSRAASLRALRERLGLGSEPPALRSTRAGSATGAHAGRALVPLPDLHQLPGPRRAARGVRPASAVVGAAPAPAWFRRADYLGDPAVPLDQAVLDLVEERTGRRPDGPVRLLTSVRTFGHVFNPVSFYYCFDRGGEQVQAVVAEVTNTPWGERHTYALATAQRLTTRGQELPRVALPGHGRPTTSWRVTEPGRAAAGAHREPPRGGRRRSTPRSPWSAASCSGLRRVLSLPAAVAARRGPHLPPGAAAQAEGRPLPPAPGPMIARRACSACWAGSSPGGSMWSRAAGGARFGPAGSALRGTITVTRPRFWPALLPRQRRARPRPTATAGGTATTW